MFFSTFFYIELYPKSIHWRAAGWDILADKARKDVQEAWEMYFSPLLSDEIIGHDQVSNDQPLAILDDDEDLHSMARRKIQQGAVQYTRRRSDELAEYLEHPVESVNYDDKDSPFEFAF